ncbi:hypothetical protein F01_440090 [Burkholderia cenocepacia]|nr:hypothetical protein F01_440090 [Burkholderia cenocepacia]
MVPRGREGRRAGRDRFGCMQRGRARQPRVRRRSGAARLADAAGRAEHAHARATAAAAGAHDGRCEAESVEGRVSVAGRDAFSSCRQGHPSTPVAGT